MSTFRPFGPLAPGDPLFRGRTNELVALKRLCQGEVEAYAIVYGGRQLGKTSLLLHLPNDLPPTVITCKIDFQSCPGADTPTVCQYLAEQIAAALPGPPAVPTVHKAPELIRFVTGAASQSDVHRLVLMLEELGTLPQVTRFDLANILRAMFSARLEAATRSLARVLVIIAGGIELYDLATTPVSALYNICQEIYLSDLAEAEAVGLVQNGLSDLGLTPSDTALLAAAIYALVHGHPYLTQRLGYVIETAVAQGDQPTVTDVEVAARQLVDTDVLMRHLRRGLKDHQLHDACRQLVTGQVRFSRLDEDMAQLELLGVARQHNGYWTVSNPLLAHALRSWLGISSNELTSYFDAKTPEPDKETNMPPHPPPPSLRDALATLYPRDADARRVARDAGLDEAQIPFDPAAINTWSAILSEAQKQNRIENILAIALKQYSTYAPLLDAVTAYREPTATPAIPPASPSSASRRHLETQRGELQQRYTTLTKRIAALDTDIGRATDSMQKQILEERRADQVGERIEVEKDLEEIERQLGEPGRTLP